MGKKFAFELINLRSFFIPKFSTRLCEECSLITNILLRSDFTLFTCCAQRAKLITSLQISVKNWLKNLFKLLL